MFQISAMMPEYATDPVLLACPTDPEIEDVNEDLGIVTDDGTGECKYVGVVTNADQSYMYTGYVFDKVEDDFGTVDPKAFGIPATDDIGFQASIFLMSLVIGGFGDGDPSNDGFLDVPLDLSQVPVPGDWGTGVGSNGKMLRLRNGIVDSLDTAGRYPGAKPAKDEASLPVIWDIIYGKPASVPRKADDNGNPILTNHEPGGSNVLYMDGHVDFSEYPKRFPANRGTVALFSAFG